MGKSTYRLFFPNTSLKKSFHGFTLVEILIVIALIGVLGSVLVLFINPLKQLERARDTKRKAEVAQIQHALEFYRSDIDEYPDTDALSACNVALQGTPPGGSTITYLKSIPCDPRSGSAYVYTQTSASEYTLKTCLENSSDPDAQADGSCSTGYSYTVSNP